ncbi:MAG TPA: peptidoglycan-associated lipoprotein Pal [Burkholderiales bacterium]|nr:peptidoglycan-associated lipoprotein Pal [Burkholderiales bacterium]
MKPVLRSIPFAVLVALTAACSTQPTADSSTAPAQSSGGTPSSSAQTAPSSLGNAPDPVRRQGMLAKRSIYYDFDKYDISAESRSLIEAHARYLRENPNVKVRIEGNADERGSTEYNLALGQQRSSGVLKVMTLLGVPAGRIEAVSFGKEKPKATGHDETSWSENRRSDIVYR